MAISYIGRTDNNKPIKDFQGLSTDTKPINNIGTNSTFFEIDTGKVWVYDNQNENTSTSDGWWEV